MITKSYLIKSTDQIPLCKLFIRSACPSITPRCITRFRDARPVPFFILPIHFPADRTPSTGRPDRSFRSLTHLSSSFRSPLLFPPYPFIRGSSLFSLSLPFLLTAPFPPRPRPSTLTRQARLITMREFREFGRRSDFCQNECSFPLSPILPLLRSIYASLPKFPIFLSNTNQSKPLRFYPTSRRTLSSMSCPLCRYAPPPLSPLLQVADLATVAVWR